MYCTFGEEGELIFVAFHLALIDIWRGDLPSAADYGRRNHGAGRTTRRRLPAVYRADHWARWPPMPAVRMRLDATLAMRSGGPTLRIHAVGRVARRFGRFVEVSLR